MQVSAMKVQQLTPNFWPTDAAEPSSPSTSSNSSFSTSSLLMGLNPLSPLAPCKLTSLSPIPTTSPCTKVMCFDSPRQRRCASQKHDSSLMETVPSGATRWNPMPEQVKVLESLYQSGMRTPNANQIEDITAELGKYGRIEVKNIFYWFQNHKARERQKQKRSALQLALTMSSSSAQPNYLIDSKQLLQQQEEGQMEMKEKGDGSCNKRKCRSWCGLQLKQSGSSSEHDQTLELFPLQPERKQMG